MTEENQSTDFLQRQATRRLEEKEKENKKSNENVKRRSSLSPKDNFDIMIRQIQIWLPICLTVVLYYAVMSIVEMPICKSSLLYAKYGSSKTVIQSQ